MAIATSFNRPKADTTLSESVPLSAAVAEVGSTFVIDIYTSINSANKVLCRIIVSRAISGNNITFTDTKYVFAGASTTYSAGGTVPPLSQAALGNTVDLDAALTANGDARANS